MRTLRGVESEETAIGMLGIRIAKLNKENKLLKATVARLIKSDLAKENESLRKKVKELERAHYIDQSQIVQYRRQIENAVDGSKIGSCESKEDMYVRR